MVDLGLINRPIDHPFVVFMLWSDRLIFRAACIYWDQVTQMGFDVGSHTLVFFVKMFSIFLLRRNANRLMRLFDIRVLHTFKESLLARQSSIFASLMRCSWVQIVSVGHGSCTATHFGRREHHLCRLQLVWHCRLQLLSAPCKLFLMSHRVREVLCISRIDEEKDILEGANL